VSTPPPETQEEYVAEANVSGRRGISVIWLVPLVALAVGAWLIYKAYTEKGPTITISFEEANGVVAGKTLVRYRDVEIGKVTKVGISEDLNRVTITAELDKDAERMLGENARFWVAQPEISVTGVRDLQTLLSGPYIGLDPDTEGASRYEFKGLDRQPLINEDQKGRYFNLKSPTSASLHRGAPVVFRGFSVGQIVGFNLVDDDSDVDVRVFIQSPHDERITENTRFWNVSGVDFEMSADGIKVNSKSMATILIGGITFGVPPAAKRGAPATEKTVLRLYENRTDAFKQNYTKHRFVVHFDDSVRGLNVGAPVEFRGVKMGEVVDVRAQFYADSLELRIPVYVDFEPERFEIIGELATDRDKQVSNFHKLIKRGMRAQLKTGSLLTGQKLVDINIYPNAEPVEVTYEDGLLVIPTIPTLLDSLTEKVTAILDNVERLPLEQIGEDLRGTLARVRKLVEEAEIQSAIDALTKTLGEAEVLVGKLNSEIVPPLGATLQQGERLTKRLNAETAPQLDDVLRELKDAARAIRVLSDYLEQHPDALIKGKN